MQHGPAGAGGGGGDVLRQEAGGDWRGGEDGVPRGDLQARGPLSDDQQDRQQVRLNVEQLLQPLRGGGDPETGAVGAEGPIPAQDGLHPLCCLSGYCRGGQSGQSDQSGRNIDK